MQEVVKGDHGRYDQIEREAFERYMLELARGWAAEEERLAQSRGKEPGWLIREVNLLCAGTKNASLEFRTWSRQQKKEFTHTYEIHAEPFLDKDGKRSKNLRRELGDVLMHLRGG